jgi:hypothetical protein
MTTRTTMQKRQKELARMEKRRDKEAKRVQRKLEKESQVPGQNPDDDLGEPLTGPVLPPEFYT